MLLDLTASTICWGFCLFFHLAVYIRDLSSKYRISLFCCCTTWKSHHLFQSPVGSIFSQLFPLTDNIAMHHLVHTEKRNFVENLHFWRKPLLHSFSWGQEAPCGMKQSLSKPSRPDSITLWFPSGCVVRSAPGSLEEKTPAPRVCGWKRMPPESPHVWSPSPGEVKPRHRVVR